MEQMKRFKLLVTDAGTKMDDTKLYNLIVVDRFQTDDLLRRTKFEELMQVELDDYVAYFNQRQEVIA